MKAKYLFLFLMAAYGNAQSPQQVLEWINTAKTENVHFYYEIPFEYKGNEIVIPVRIGRQEYDYIFDTGGYNNITDAMQEQNKYPVLTTQTVGSSNKIKSKVNIVRVDSITVGGLVFKDIAALQLDFSKSPTIRCIIDGGIIGASIIKDYIWQIDYPNRKIIVTDQKEKLQGLEGATKVAVTFNNRLMPFIDMKIGARTEKVMFDLGSATLFSMSKKTAKRHHKQKEAILIKGGSTEGANGTIQEDIHVFKAPVIGIEALEFKNKPIYYTDSNNENLIGNPIIKNYVVTLNFKEGELFLLPIKENPPEEGWKSFGFSLDYKGGKVEVATLYKGLAADRAGLQLNDQVVAIDGKAVDCSNDCDCSKMLAEELNTKEVLKMTVVRNTATIIIEVKREQVF